MDTPAQVDLFEKADLYDWQDDQEYLSCDSPDDAICECVDSHIAGLNSADERINEIREMGDITIYAFQRDVLDPKFCERAADRAFETFEESWADEYGNVDDGTAFENTDSAIVDQAKKMIEDAFKLLCEKTPVWRCSKVAHRDYPVDEVIRIAKERWPELFA